MRVLVTGGAGYVGSHAVRALVAAGHDVCVFDNLSRGHRQAVPAGLLVQGDLADTRALAALLADRRTEIVLHFAGLALVGEAVADPALYWRNNVQGSLSLLEAMRAAGVGRLVFSSTTATYGAPPGQPIRETAPQQPINPYGRTKLVVEQALADHARAYGLAYAALRYFNAAGAAADGTLGEDHDPETHLIPLVLQVALGQREQVSLFGTDYPTPDGTCVRDYVHVEDLARAHLLAMERLVPGEGLVVNLGSGTGHSVREVVEACRAVSGRPIPAVEAARRPGDPPVLVADVSRAAELLDWRPEYVELERIVASAWRWHQSHPRGFGG